MSIYIKELATPAGLLLAGANDQGLWLCDYVHRRQAQRVLQRIGAFAGQELRPGDHPLHAVLEAQLSRYFEGSLQVFDLPLRLAGTPFQQRVWEALLRIPYGETRSYRQQALACGDEKAVRAVAAANGANALSIVVPCHRVIGANRSLTGYAGGLRSKQWLLEHEGRHHAGARQQALF